MKRILLLLSAPRWSEAADAISSAMSTAAHPELLSIGLSLHEVPSDDDLAGMRSISRLQYLAPAFDPWQDMEVLWQGEAYVLAGHPGMRFERQWDRTLLRCLRDCRRYGRERNVLTGFLPRQVDPVDAVYPVALRRFDRRGRLLLQRGTPLRYASHPQRSAFVHPDFCFGPALFFRSLAQESEGPLFLQTYRLKWDAYTLNRPVIHMAWDDPLPPIELPVEDQSGTFHRFESRFDINASTRKVSAMAACGIFQRDLTFPTRVPLGVRMQEALRNLDNRGNRLQPMCVTAWLMIPGVPLDEQRMTCYRRLCAMRHMNLISYADNDCMQRVRISNRNALEYKSRYGLHAPAEAMRSNRLDYVRLCKPFILQQTREKYMTGSHLIWLDWDYMRYPVYTRAAFDWETVCGDRIVLAMVDGVPDTSMIVVPQQLIEPLCREIFARCQATWELLGKLPEEKQLWLDLMNACPNWFTTHHLPGRYELLAVTMQARGEEMHTRG